MTEGKTTKSGVNAVRENQSRPNSGSFRAHPRPYGSPSGTTKTLPAIKIPGKVLILQS